MSFVPQPMSTAPKDGTRILLHRVLLRYGNPHKVEDVRDGKVSPNAYRLGHRYPEWHIAGERWEECHWVNERDGSPSHWEPWGGSTESRTTDHIPENYALAWSPLP